MKALLPENLIGLKLQAIVNDPANRYGVDAPDIQQLLKLHWSSMDMDLVRDYFRLFEKEDLLDEWLKRRQGAPRRPRDGAPNRHRPPRPARGRDRRRAGARERPVVGRLYEERGIAFVVAENRRINQDLLVPQTSGARRRRATSSSSRSSSSPSPQREAIARVVEVLGGYTDPAWRSRSRCASTTCRTSSRSPRGSRRASCRPRSAARDRAGRVDITALPLVTIDGETAKDFDDAVYCARNGKGFRLVVAIADVSHYVKDGDALDRDARERGTSVYFPRRVIPMLPEALSNELCSLKPNVDRLCMVCDMGVSRDGAIGKYEFYPAVMHSRARLTYTQVWDWLSEPKRAPREAKALLPHLADLYALYHALKAAREARGAIDFESVEMALEFDVQGKIVRIVPVVRNDAHKLIEECMLAANVCTAEFLAAHKHPALYRVHEGPTRKSSRR